MSTKLKIVLVFVAVVAGFLVYRGTKYIHTLANQDYFQTGTPLPTDEVNCATCDPDHDGLDNQQEIIWGTDPFNPDSDGDSFKDGEEINSGHNPLVPGPDDALNDSNLTNQLSDLTVAGIFEGAINPASESYAQTLTDIASSVADNATYIFSKTVSPDSISTIPSNANSNTSYVKAMTPVLQEFGNTLDNDLSKIKDNLNAISKSGFSDSAKKFFAQQSTLYGSLNSSAELIPVPKSFVNSHANFLSISQQMRTIDDSLAHGDEDTVKAAFALKSLGDVYNEYLNYLSSLSGLLATEPLLNLDQ